MNTLEELAAKVESLRAEVAELKARPPSIVVNRGDQLAVTGIDLLKSQLLLKVEAAPEPEKPADPAPPNPKCPACGTGMILDNVDRRLSEVESSLGRSRDGKPGSNAHEQQKETK